MKTLLAALALVPASAFPWGADGHQTVGALADRLIAGTPAQSRVKALLGMPLRDAATWADCARGVDVHHGYAYTKGQHPECAVHETPQGIAAMQDYVRRNDRNCRRKGNEPSCHTQYHYTDVALQRERYAAGEAGTRDDDAVAAAVAAIRVLQGRPAPAPFSLASPREALLLLAHLAGDLHQPLHVGAVYLDADGHRLDPDPGPVDDAPETHGGNDIVPVDAKTGHAMTPMHAMWDTIPAALLSGHIDAAWRARARAVPALAGAADDAPAQWATAALPKARSAFDGVRFKPKKGGVWNATLPVGYRDRMNQAKSRQLTVAGGRLAQVLRELFPAAP